MKKALIVLSGGQDSTTCLYAALAEGFFVDCLTFNYGQRHQRELNSAWQIYQIVKGDYPAQVGEHIVLEVGPILRSTSPLVSTNELEQYADSHSLPGGIEKTFVPMRNMLFLTLAANYAVALGCEMIYTGVCQEDFGGYPDCRRVFIDAVQEAINRSNEGAYQPIEIVTPLMYMTKAESVHFAVRLADQGFSAYGALAYSHTAYDGKYPPTGHDHATLLRAKGFEEAGLPDPLILRAVAEGEMDPPYAPNYHSDVVRKMQKYLDFTCK